MQLISTEGKTNFFEKQVSEYRHGPALPDTFIHSSSEEKLFWIPSILPSSSPHPDDMISEVKAYHDKWSVMYK